MTALPKRVAADLQAAEALEAQYVAQRGTAVDIVTDASQLLVPPAPDEPIPSATPPAPPAPPQPAAPKPEDFEHKYRVLQGMYAADVKTLKDQVKDLTAMVQRAAERPEPPAPQVTVDPKDVEAFGQDLVEMVKRYADQRYADVERRIQALEQAVHGVSQRTEESADRAFYATLDRLVPNWREINQDHRWLQWLGQRDALTRKPRQAVLDEAFANKDAEHVATVFEAFVKSLPPAVPPPSLETELTPTSVSTPAAPPAPPAHQFISAKFITNFYNDVAKGKYRGREAEQAQIEAQIDLATAEGRVR